MKKIIKNYIIRDPKDLVIAQGGNYQTSTFSPTVENQVIFDNIIPLGTNIDMEKTELYVNGLRYDFNVDYRVSSRYIEWINSYPLRINDKITFIYR